MKLVKLATFSSQAEAEMFSGLLREKCLSSLVQPNNLFLYLGSSFFISSLMVPESTAQQARNILDSYSTSHEAQTGIPKKPNKFISGIISISVLLLGLGLGDSTIFIVSLMGITSSSRAIRTLSWAFIALDILALGFVISFLIYFWIPD